MSSASETATGLVMPGRKPANSSPPKRLTSPRPAKRRARSCATSTRQKPPMWWPCASFIRLSPSMSRTSTASGAPPLRGYETVLVPMTSE